MTTTRPFSQFEIDAAPTSARQRPTSHGTTRRQWATALLVLAAVGVGVMLWLIERGAAPRITCAASSAVVLQVLAGSISDAIEYELQLSNSDFEPFMSQTSEQPTWTIRDLHPGSTYALRMRVRRALPLGWSELGARTECSTPPLLVGQPLVIPPTMRPGLDYVVVRVRPPQRAEGSLDLVCWVAASNRVVKRRVIAINGTADVAVRLTGLAAGEEYLVTAAAGDLMSPAVLHRTARRDAALLDAYRVSELCSHEGIPSLGLPLLPACQPDYLSNHAAADALPTAMLAGTIWAFVEQYKTFREGTDPWSAMCGNRPRELVITRYCVEHDASLPWAEYSSCNVPAARAAEASVGAYPLLSHCQCMSWQDRCFTREACRLSTCENTTAADGGVRSSVSATSAGCAAHFSHEERPLLYSTSYPKCECSAAAREAAAHAIGRAPLAIEAYGPTLPLTGETGGAPSCSITLTTRGSLGHWYSLPASAECAVGHREQWPGAGGCTWARQASQYLVTGAALQARGFRPALTMFAPSPVDDGELAQAYANRRAMDAALNEHGERCCGC